jgi:alkaline phosphatase
MKNLKKILVTLMVLAFVSSNTSPLFAKENNKNGSKKPPKNVILLISDGCGYNQVEAANLYEYGKTGAQVYEKFSVQLGMSTYMDGGSYDGELAWADFDYVKSGATDSAAAATTMSTGVKTYSGAIGVDIDEVPLYHALDLAEDQGKATGVVTSVEWTHATPAGFVAHNISRNNYAEIGQEMIYDSRVDVIMGCGHPWYDADGNRKGTANTFKYVGGEDTWNDLVAGDAGGDADGDGIDDPWLLVQERDMFRALMVGPTPKRVVGVAQVYQTLQQGRSGNDTADPYFVPLIESVPTLEEMTRAALNILDDDEDGFFLMIEGGAVDWASHANQSGRVIEEEIDFNKSVEAVVEWVQENSKWGETLVIVTGDHETGYLTGPGSDPTWEFLVNNGAGVLPGMEWHSDSHTNSLIPFYAKGSCAELFGKKVVGTDPVRGDYIDNTDIGKLLAKMFSE